MIDIGKISLAVAEFLAPLRKANWKWILLCFSTAATFWFFNALNKVYTTRIDYPVQLVFDRDSLAAVIDPPEEIPINVTGGGWQLLKRTVSFNITPVTIEPENPVQTKFFTASNLLPFFSNQLTDLNINYIATDTIFFDIEQYVDRRLCVKLDSAGIQLRKNYYITSEVSVIPDSVTFHGPTSLIHQLPDVFIVRLPDKNIEKSYDEELSLDLFSSSLIKKVPEVIHVQFNVQEMVEQSEVFPIEKVNFPYDSTVEMQENQVQASFKIQWNFRNKLKKEDFLFIADLNNVQNSDSTIAVEVMNAPEYVRDIVIRNNRLKVTYAK